MEKSIFAGLIPLLFLGTAPSPRQTLTSLLNAEKAEYSLLTYSQHYLDKDNAIVQYQGTLYLKIESFAVDDCSVKIDILVQDRYTGTEEKPIHRPEIHTDSSPRSYTYRYSYQLDLKSIANLQTLSIKARPYQLLENTASVCVEETDCRLFWLRLQTATPAIKEIRILNGLTDFKQSVDNIAIPMTSRDAAQQAAESLNQLSAACH